MNVINSILEKFQRSDAYRAIVEADEAALDEQRAAALQALARAQKARDRARPRAVAARDEAIKRVRAVEKQLLEASAAAVAAQRELAAVDGAFRDAERRADSALRATTPREEILDVRRALDETFQRARGAYMHSELVTQPQLFYEPQSMITRSNVSMTEETCAACLAGIRRCDELLLAPLTRAEILEALAGVRAAIPQYTRNNFTTVVAATLVPPDDVPPAPRSRVAQR